MDTFFLIISAFGLITSGRQFLKVLPLREEAPRVFWTYGTLVLFWLVFIVRILTDTPALAVATISLLAVHLYLKYFGIKRGVDGVRQDSTALQGHKPSPPKPF